MSGVLVGLERLVAEPGRYLERGERVGLIANPTAIDHELNHAVDLLHRHEDVRLVALFGPEHGLRAEVQDMLAVEGSSRDERTGLPLYSLYGQDFDSLSPTEEALSGLDVLLFDLQDIGSRYYTYAAPRALAMRACGRADVRVIVLDRPNPLGGVVIEGGGLEPELESFVGLHPVPQRHGMTVGELARLYLEQFGDICELDVVTCKGWERQQYFDATDLPWVMPSPNMPTLDTAIVYPGMALLEGTNLSEGRGTTRPFEIFGAPFVDGDALRAALSELDLPGVRFRPLTFQPTFHKHQGQRCGGLQLHVTDREAFQPYRTGLAVLWATCQLYPGAFAWRTEAYEFRDDVPALDLLVGTASVRLGIDRGEDLGEVYELATRGAERYHAGRASALLY